MKVIALAFLLLFTPSYAGEPKVTLHLLDHTGKEPGVEKFWIDWSKNWRAIEKTKSIEGNDAKIIVDPLKISLKSTECMNLCGHDPIYGIIARDQNDQIIKTSLCFKCGTWVKPRLRLDIGGEFGINNPLCLLLRKHIELPRALLEPESEPKAVKNP